jgi:pimeloyl-ACP methyl ester carboxylesterase
LIDVDGRESFFEVDHFGDPWVRSQAPILIQHGMIRNSRFWTRWIPRLAATRPVIRRDLIGHGRSEDPGAGHGWSIDTLTEELARFLEAVEVPVVHYVGDSFGGILGAAFAARYPARVKTLTLCSTPPRSPETTKVKRESERAAETIERLGTVRYTKLLIANGVIHASGPEHERWVLKEAARTPTHVCVGIVDMMSPPEPSQKLDVTPLLSTLSMPVLIIAPGQSPMVSLAEQMAMVDATPDGEIAVIPAPGHEVYVTGANLCIDALQDFLRRKAEEA